MTDDPNREDDVQDETYEAEATEGGVDAGAILEEARQERLHRQAYWHGTSKQLFAFLFANCMFFASGFAAWTRAGYSPEGVALPVDGYALWTGLDTIRGTLIFALSLYGFWTAVFNIWHAQMKVWPYLLAAVLALWVGIGGFVAGIGGEQWERSKLYLESLESKTMMDDMLTPLGVIAPGYWLCTFGGLIVVWVIVMGLVQGGQAAKGAAAPEGGGSGRKRR